MTEEAFFAIDMAYTNRDDSIFALSMGDASVLLLTISLSRAPKL